MTCEFCHFEHLLAVPTVHLNGTSAKDLYEQLDAAVQAVGQAMERLVAAAPNERDYQVQGEGANRRARNQHDARWGMLHGIQRELIEMRDHVMAVIANGRGK